ncbi:efflux RND transporter permease subunit [Geosporobacter ferrireducens]|uniref:Acriflavin resistance protein n=1 Tax=Geosporobacter ferrireducens TaxID=1424294 RepID=A0A1D8GGX2_9FIRM|nr:efflux RND transporter permease subunit [Geosporobacter ferrireducens]AOT70143.1 acriflavin resistance protein [Geosporobacter ferrireducens]
MTRWCIKHRSIVAIISIFIFLGGLYIYNEMERQENPDVASPGATIQVIYPGATPEDVEKFIIKPLEKRIAEISEVKRMQSYALDSVGVIVVRLHDLSDAEIEKAWNSLKDKVSDAEADFPDQAWSPKIDTDLVETYGMLMTLSGKDVDYKELKSIADEIKNKIEKEKGVSEVKLEGYENDEVQVDLDILKMRQFQLSIDTVAKLLAARNVNIPGGNLELAGSKLPVTTTGEYKEVEEIKNTIVGMSSRGNVIYLKDIANVQKVEKKRDTYISYKGEKALLLAVKYADGQNVVRVGKRLNAQIDDFRKAMPEGVTINIITDQAQYVDESIKNFEKNLMSAIFLVVVVVLLTMGWRSALVVSTSIPITVMFTFVFMKMTGVILHQVSISSLIVCLGLLVANAIVANDNMYLYLSKGRAKEEAIVEGIREVNIPILTSTLTTIASFLPLLMMQGVAGKFIKTLPLLVTVALMSSYICSLTAVPVMGYTFLKVEDKKAENPKKKKGIKQFFTSQYEWLLDFAIKRPRTVIALAIGALLGSGLLIPTLGLQLFPFVERDQYVIDVSTMDGNSLEKTREVTGQIEKILQEEPSVENYLLKVGDGIPKFYTSFFPNQIATNKAQFIVNGKKEEIKNIQHKLDGEIAGARIEAKQLENAVPVGMPVQIRVSGEDVDVLRKISKDIKEQLYEIQEGYNVQDDYGLEVQKMIVEVNQEKANMSGITNYDIGKMVRMVVNGLEITKIKPDDSDEDVAVVMKIPTEDKSNKEILENIYVTSQVTKKNVPLMQIAEIRNEFAINKILRRDRERTITVGLYPKDGHTASELLKIVEDKMEGYELPMGYTMVFGGENEDRTEAFKSLIGPFYLAAALIYLVLVFQFFDLRKPLIIMGTIPLSFIGVIWGLKITGYPIGFMALMGGVSLMGIVVNNGIVLLDYINTLSCSGMEVKTAVKEASLTRLRPIMIGMITTVIGLVPMGLSGGSLWAPLAYSIIFGLLVSSVLTMLVIPAAFMTFDNSTKANSLIISRIKGKLKKKKNKEVENPGQA